jgi:ribonuclease BN (tRNA processing enzyme)
MSHATSPIRVHVIGAGTPLPARTRFGSAWLIDLGGERLLFDCGPAATQKLVRHGFAPTDVDHLFFTHHHFDHDADYGTFVLSRWDQGADSIPDLRVYGPWPTQEITDRLFGTDGAFAYDIAARIGNPSSQQAHRLRGGRLPRRPPMLDVREIRDSPQVSGQGWEVRAARVEHVQPFLASLAYRIVTRRGDVVISGDCLPTDAFAEFASGAHTLLMMCWDRQSTMASTGLDIAMTGTTEAGRIAAQAGIKRLILVHLGPALDGEVGQAEATADVRSNFAGETIFATEETFVDL